MKKLLISFVLVAIASVSAFSQVGDLKKQTYFRIGLSVPGWKYGGNDDKSDWPDGTKRTGGIFEVGSIYMLNGIKLAPGMRIGINLDFLSVNYHRFTFKEFEGMSENFVYLSSKIGPSFSYSPVQKLVFDAYFKFNPVWVAADFEKSGNEGIEDQAYLGFLGIKYSVGLNIRYSILMMGIELNPGYGKLKQFDKEEGGLTDVYLGNVKNNGSKTPIPGLNVTLGLSF